MTKDEALRLALKAMVVNNQAWKYLANSGDAGNFDAEEQGYYQLNEQAITAIKAALEAKDEPVAWDGYNLDDMCEAFNRVIEEHFHRKHPFHDPVNNDAMIALRTLRGFIPYMKRHTTPPQQEAKDEPVAFKIYKPTPPRGAIPNVRDAELPWVYDQDPSSGNVASMWVTPVQTLRSKK